MTNRGVTLAMALMVTVVAGCGGDPQKEKEAAGMMRALAVTSGRDAEENGDLHEAEDWYEKAIEYSKDEGSVDEDRYEDLHRIQQKLNEKYGEGN
ncbi:hypothetical protein GYB59_16965 [bacterium]|nr:hypothetical protein [bacterium]